ncbi:hypothetical protein ACTWP5_05205 [Streptomyces sp. 4N509B]|uniref:hypothetical protein n=1 Tax=Streptomyces sp. 4N509B TaxID=3457413 RepID=UPI003FD24B79
MIEPSASTAPHDSPPYDSPPPDTFHDSQAGSRPAPLTAPRPAAPPDPRAYAVPAQRADPLSVSSPHVIPVRYDGGPRHGTTVDLVITGEAVLPLIIAARDADRDLGLYELRSTEGGGTRYAWIDDLPRRTCR